MAKARLPAFMLKHANFASLAAGDVEMPRLKLLQATSPELAEFGSAAQGEFWHSMAAVRLGSTVRICPVYIDTRFILWRPRIAGGGILARADDGKHWMPPDTEFAVKLESGREVKWQTSRTVRESGLDKRGSYDPSEPNSRPAAQRMYSIVCAFPDRQDLPPAVLILQEANIKAAIKLIGELKVLRAPSFGVILELTSFEDRSLAGKYHSCAFQIFGPVEERALYEDNFAQYRFFLEHGLRVQDLEEAQED